MKVASQVDDKDTGFNQFCLRFHPNVCNVVEVMNFHQFLKPGVAICYVEITIP